MKFLWYHKLISPLTGICNETFNSISFDLALSMCNVRNTKASLINTRKVRLAPQADFATYCDVQQNLNSSFFG